MPVIFRLQYSSGMRPQEVRRLRCIDFNFDYNTVYIAEGKRHKDRRLPINEDVMEMCKRYNLLAEKLFPNRKYFFEAETGKPYSAYMGHEKFSATYYYIHLLPERLALMDFTRSDGIIPVVRL